MVRRRRGIAPPRIGRGRRKGAGSSTRAAIVAAAGQRFARHGYPGVSFREIARAAGVDPALIYHYFDGKERLFLESLQLMFRPLRPSRPASRSGPEDLGERIVLRFLEDWTGEGSGQPFLGILRACVTSDRAAGLIRKFVAERVVPAVREDVGPEVRVRTALVGSQLFGIGVARHLLRLEPLPSLSNEQIAHRLGPLVTATLLGGRSAGGAVGQFSGVAGDTSARGTPERDHSRYR